MLNIKGKKYCIGSLLIMSILPCCKEHGHSKNPENKTSNPAATNASIRSVDTIYAGEGDTIILDGESYIKGHIVANKNQPKYTLAARKGQKLTAIIKPMEKGGNVRINQIRQPGGAFDGPFGDSLSYTFKKSGNIRIIIGENLMAGDPYTGDFILHIKLSEP